MAGGRWTDRVSPTIRHNLRWFWVDGVFAQVVEAITLAYLSLYVLALGATRAQIGWLSALSSLSAALLLLPGAALAERPGRRKQLVLISGGGIARAALLLLALAPLALDGAAVIHAAIALAVIREASANLGLPAWVSLTADIVPLAWRGRYFGSRNVAMGLMGMATTLVVGQLITRIGGPAGYQLALGLAFAAGMVSTFSFARLREPAAPIVPPAPKDAPPLSLFQHFRAHPAFLIFCATTALWNFSLNVAGPFFNIYVVQGLRGDAGVVGLLSVVSALSGLPGQRVFGTLADRWGPRRVQLLTSLLIPWLPLAWVFVRAPWHVIPINLVAGFLWAGYTLASFNLLLALAPEDQRPRYTALYQIVVLAGLASGAAVGGLVITDWGYQAVFILSGAGRLVAALLFARFVRGEPPVTRETARA
jgi:MFS family permease